MLRLILTILFVVGSGAGCVTSVESEVKVNESIDDDEEYSSAYENYTKNIKIIDEWATKYELTITFLGDGFLGAFSNRYQRLYQVQEPLLAEATDKTGFFVSVFSPESKGYDLVDQQLWKIFLDDRDGRKIKPSLVKELGEKKRWEPFFRGVNHWSKEYLIVFDTNLVDPATDGLVQKKAINLVFSNADAHVNVQW